jgi:hypothetical protein
VDINIRIDVSPGTARRMAVVGVTLLLAGIAAFANALPITFAPHQKLTASDLNKNFSGLENRIAAVETTLDQKASKSALPMVTDWVAYTPAMTTESGKSVANQTTRAFYRRVGDSLEVRTFTAFSAAPKSNAVTWTWSLPDGLKVDVVRAGALATYCLGAGLAQGANENFVVGVYAFDTSRVSAVPGGNPSYHIADQTPFAFDTESSISLVFTVPIESWHATP